MTDPLTQAEAALAKMREMTRDIVTGEPLLDGAYVDLCAADLEEALPAFEAIVAELRERREAEARFKSNTASQRSYMYGVGHNAAVLLHPDGTQEFIKPVIPEETNDE